MNIKSSIEIQRKIYEMTLSAAEFFSICIMEKNSNAGALVISDYDYCKFQKEVIETMNTSPIYANEHLVSSVSREMEKLSTESSSEEIYLCLFEEDNDWNPELRIVQVLAKGVVEAVDMVRSSEKLSFSTREMAKFSGEKMRLHTVIKLSDTPLIKKEKTV